MIINEEASFHYDDQFDALKIYGNDDAPQFYSVATDSTRLSLNTIPNAHPNISIPLGFSTETSGLFEMKLSEINGFDSIPVFLEDRNEQCIINLKTDNSYNFFTDSGLTEGRFVLRLFSSDIPVHQNSLTFVVPAIFVNQNSVLIKSTQSITGNISIVDLLGRVIISKEVSESKLLKIDMANSHGFYFVRVNTGVGLHTQKIYIPN